MSLDIDRAKRKMGFLRRLIHKYDIVMLQEVHGNPEAWDRFASDVRHSHCIKYSLSEAQALAGIAFIIKRSVAERASKLPHPENL